MAPSGAPSDNLPVAGDQFTGQGLCVQPRDRSSSLRDCLAEPVRHRFDIPPVAQRPWVPVIDAAAVPGDYRNAKRHSLDPHDAEGFLPAAR